MLFLAQLFSALTVQVKSTPDGLRLNITTEEIRWTDGTWKRINEIGRAGRLAHQAFEKDEYKESRFDLALTAAPRGGRLKYTATLRMPAFGGSELDSRTAGFFVDPEACFCRQFFASRFNFCG